VRLLVLLDVDGTLFLTHDQVAGRALRETLQERFGVRLPGDAIQRIDHDGQTSLRIGRLVLEAAGVDGKRIEDGLADWCARFAERYVDLLAHADTSGWRHPARSRRSSGSPQQATVRRCSRAIRSPWRERA
jgi:beta-phosphoglucomutase-like phosphatase (HAD superfamily)